ncbi:hypothetical protein GQ602_000175 [Ophiocordyceps camponoti-floridani]|uniref:Uncharacterized protein n=1 Tax=Ophiocordyceps camponoti-floridani TaxID=2030778 RepID=A0A8H4QBR3_9HYPO|nr:hypothetical protein GQ602_000175 [Ophiocordyceps camponoti-floridani]
MLSSGTFQHILPSRTSPSKTPSAAQKGWPIHTYSYRSHSLFEVASRAQGLAMVARQALPHASQSTSNVA